MQDQDQITVQALAEGMRGKVVVENGQFSGTLGSGQFLRRKVDADVTNRPVC